MSKRIKEKIEKESSPTVKVSECVGQLPKHTNSTKNYSRQTFKQIISKFISFHFLLFLIWLGGLVFILWWVDLLPAFSKTDLRFGERQTKGTARRGRYTPEELAQYDGRDPSKPLLLAIMGRVYDVTKGYDKYGPGRSYHFFTGKDATRSFITGCFNDECFAKQPKGLEGLSAKEIQTLKDWVAFYDTTYTYVGELVDDSKK
jgi:predicted heme/steroid binding protein